MNEKISIVIPCYKAERCIENIVQDLKAQDYTNWELIIVSNGQGQEAQLEIIKKLANGDKRISWYSIPEGGQGPARNIGMEHATGEWITFVDADDDVTPNWLSNYISASHGNPDIICAEYCHNFWMSKGLHPCRVICNEAHYEKLISNAKEFLPILLSEEHIVAPPWNKMLSMSFIKRTKIRFRSEIYEDYIFNFQAAIKASSMVFIHDGGYRYNVSFDSGVMARYSYTHEVGGLLRINTWCDALMASGMTEASVYARKIQMLGYYSLQELLNTFRLNSPCHMKDRVAIVKKQFSQSWMPSVVQLQRTTPTTILERLFCLFYKINMPTLCVIVFSNMHFVRRHMKHVSAFVLRHLH